MGSGMYSKRLGITLAIWGSLLGIVGVLVLLGDIGNGVGLVEAETSSLFAWRVHRLAILRSFRMRWTPR